VLVQSRKTRREPLAELGIAIASVAAKDSRMKELILPLMACAALGVAGCDRNDRTEADVSRDAAAAPVDANTRDVTPPVVGTDQHAPDEVAQPTAVQPTAVQPTAVQPSAPADDRPGQVADAPQSKQEFVAASKRRLEQLERELEQLEARSKERGKQMRAEIREEKRRLDTELDRLDAQSEAAWSDMKQGFANALEKLEGEIREVRKDVDPDA
jgi:hypothetical protein